MPASTPFRFESFGLSIRRGEPRPMLRVHSHTEIEINFLLRGGMTYRFAGEEVKIVPGCLYLYSGLTPHVLEQVAFGTDWFCLTVPLAAFLRWKLPAEVSAPVLRGEILADDDDAVNDPRRFTRWLEDLEGTDLRRVRVVLPEVQARLERMALSPALRTAWHRHSTAERSADAGTLSRIETMLHTIADRFAEPLTLREIARQTDWHPHYAAGQFRRLIGVSPGEFLLRQRVAYARHLLATTDTKVLSISEECGFASQSCFYSAFGRMLKCSPGAFRRKMP